MDWILSWRSSSFASKEGDIMRRESMRIKEEKVVDQFAWHERHLNSNIQTCMQARAVAAATLYLTSYSNWYFSSVRLLSTSDIKINICFLLGQILGWRSSVRCGLHLTWIDTWKSFRAWFTMGLYPETLNPEKKN